MVQDCIGPNVKGSASKLPATSTGRGAILLLENLRCYKQEESNDPVFAGELASIADNERDPLLYEYSKITLLYAIDFQFSQEYTCQDLI